MPGCEWMKVVYQDDEVVIRESSPECVIIYHNTMYNTPLYGKLKAGWLCSGDWHWRSDGWTNFYSNNHPKTTEELVKLIKNRH